MKSYSLHQQSTYFLSGFEFRINFNHVSVEIETLYGTETQWECEQVLLPIESSRDQIVEAISLIDTTQSESLADGWFVYKQTMSIE